VVTAAASWVVLGGAALRRHGRALGTDLHAGDLAAARRRLPALCGRDPAALDICGLARAGVESVAENTSDAVVAPLLWGAVAGVPGLLAYRAANTLDAMIGNRGARYARFGWAAARLDDVANLLPARVTALTACACAPVVAGAPGDAYWALRRSGHAHPSPNAGRVEAAFAGALGVRLGGEVRYPYGVENRPTLGFGRPARPEDLARAARLSGAVTVASLGLAVVLAAATDAVSARLGGAAGAAGRWARRLAGPSTDLGVWTGARLLGGWPTNQRWAEPGAGRGVRTPARACSGVGR
jgi:adenosylcobinamide-phosphate synthase